MFYMACSDFFQNDDDMFSDLEFSVSTASSCSTILWNLAMSQGDCTINHVLNTTFSR